MRAADALRQSSRRALRFGVIDKSGLRPTAWLDIARRVEDSGVDVLLMRDHFVDKPFGPQLAPSAPFPRPRRPQHDCTWGRWS